MPPPSRGAWRFRDVTQGNDFHPTLESIRIQQLHPDGVTTFNCRVVKDAASLLFENEDRVWVKFGTNKIWAGHLNIVGRGYFSRIGTRYWDLAGRDYTAKLDDSVVTYQRDRPRESAAARVAFILDHLNFPITTSGVDLPDEMLDRANFHNMTVEEALAFVDSELNTFHYIDYGPDDGGAPDLHMFRTETFNAPFDLDDENPDYEDTFPFGIDGVYDRRDSSELATAIHVVGDDIRQWVPDPDQIDQFGRQEMPITDMSLVTEAQLRAAGRRALNQHDRPKVEGEMIVWEPGLRAGMGIDINSGVWGVGGFRVITSVDITAVDPEDDDGEAYLFSRIQWSDRRRIGRMPGAPLSRIRKHIRRERRRPLPDPGPGGGGGDEPIEDPDPPTGPVGEQILDDWERTFAGGPQELDNATYEGTGTSHSIPYPDGLAPNRSLFLLYTNTDSVASFPTQLVLLGWSQIQAFVGVGSPPTSGGAYAFFITTGNIDDLGDALELTTLASTSVSAYMALISGGPLSSADFSSLLVAGEATPGISGWASETELTYLSGHDSQTVNNATIFSPWDPVVGLLEGTAALAVYRGTVVGAFNAGDFAASSSGEQHTGAFALRFNDPGWDRIPFGQGVDHDGPWEGGNVYLPLIFGSATATINSGVGEIAISSDGATVSMVLRSDAPDDPNSEPAGPWQDGAGMLRYLWKVNPLGDTGDVDSNFLEWKIITEAWRGAFRVNLGDAVTYAYQSGGDEVGIVLYQKSTPVFSDFVPKSLVADTWYWTRMDFRDTRVRMKLWADGDDEPTAWDIDVPKIDEDLGEDDVQQLWLNVEGNSGMLFSFEEAYAQVAEDGGGGPSQPGDEELPLGDGVTTTWTVRPWVGAIWIYVDGVLTDPASVDPVQGTFTFDRAPDVGAYIIALYTAA